MNEQELYDKINQLPSFLGWQGHGAKVMVAKDSVLELVRQLDGYEVEREKLYTVEIPNSNSTLNEFQVLALAKNGHGEIQITQFLPGYDWKNDGRCQLTESEIRKDFDWAWRFRKEVE